MSDAKWGIGVNIQENGEVGSYGYPESRNPNNFCPDRECCSKEEIEKHKKAIIDYDNMDLTTNKPPKEER